MEIKFKHHQTAHCENGVATNLLKNKNIDISEPMVFGIGSGLFFFYFPFLEMNQAPLISYRPMPGNIFNKTAKRLNIKVTRMKFSDKEKAKKILDDNLAKGIPVGLQVGVYHLPYFPDEYRFHFNAHNLVVYGKNEKGYLISDPVMQETTILTEYELEKVRFARGMLSPKGQMYYPTTIPNYIDWEKAIKKGIRNTCSNMLSPLPFIGVKAIRFLARSIPKWVKKKGTKVANHYLVQMIRMQEEIGTGGGGFRFMYGAFLQEASIKLNNPKLYELSHEMTYIGDLWRDFAISASRVYKKRGNQNDVYNYLTKQLLHIADLEDSFFKKLRKAI